MEVVLYWQCAAVVHVLLQKWSECLRFFDFKTREKMVHCFPSLEISMHRVHSSLFVEKIPTHPERISMHPSPLIVNQFRHGEAMCAHLKKLLLFVTVPCYMLAFAICFAAGLENAVHSLHRWVLMDFMPLPAAVLLLE